MMMSGSPWQIMVLMISVRARETGRECLLRLLLLVVM